MLLEIFEIRGSTEPEIDKLLLKLHKKFPDMTIRKINVLDENSMARENGIKDILRRNRTEILPIFRLDGKIVKKENVFALL